MSYIENTGVLDYKKETMQGKGQILLHQKRQASKISEKKKSVSKTAWKSTWIAARAAALKIPSNGI
jgi:hypothetical protein